MQRIRIIFPILPSSVNPNKSAATITKCFRQEKEHFRFTTHTHTVTHMLMLNLFKNFKRLLAQITSIKKGPDLIGTDHPLETGYLLFRIKIQNHTINISCVSKPKNSINSKQLPNVDFLNCIQTPSFVSFASVKYINCGFIEEISW